MLEIDDLWINIDDGEVLKGINLRIPVGETHILFGKNGSGKSSLLMSIMGWGFLNVKIEGLPPALEEEMEHTIQESGQGL